MGYTKLYTMKKTNRAYLAPDVILSMLLCKDNGMLEKMLNRDDIVLCVSDFALYEAIGCLKPREKLNLLGLQKLLLKSEFIASNLKMELNDKRKRHLRSIALSNKQQ